MQKKYPVINFDELEIIEHRKYLKYFDEPSNVYNSHYNKFFNFDLLFDFGNKKGSLEIPNCGGHVDSCPSSSLQLDWTASKIRGSSFQQTWATNWNILDLESYISFNDVLFSDNAVLSSLCFETNLHGLNAVFLNIYKNEFKMEKLWIFNGESYFHFEIDEALNKRLMDFSTPGNKTDYAVALGEVLKTDQILIDSRLHVNIRLE
jgi:hypothetical protein